MESFNYISVIFERCRLYTVGTSTKQDQKNIWKSRGRIFLMQSVRKSNFITHNLEYKLADHYRYLPTSCPVKSTLAKALTVREQVFEGLDRFTVVVC